MQALWNDLLVSDVPLLEKAVRTLAVYLFLLVGLRLAGKRELGQLNPLDLVVLLMLSNTVQNAIIGPDDSLTGGMFGAVVLLVADYAALRFLYRHPRMERVLEGDPELLIDGGVVIDRALDHNLITRAELESAARRQGIEELGEVLRCRLEVGGALTFVPREPTPDERRHAELVARLDALERQLARVAGAGGA